MNATLILNALHNMTDAERIEVWNSIHGKNCKYHIYRMDELNQVCDNLEPLEVLRHFHSPKAFTPFDEYWIDLNEDGARITISFDHTEQCLIYDENKILDYIADFGLSGLPVLAKALCTTRVLAESIYKASADLDHMDYAETLESDIDGLETVLKALGDNNILYKALERIYG